MTAEGALAVVIENTDRSLRDMRALILGGGRVGKSVARVLRGLCRRVFTATADPAEYALAPLFADGVYRFCEYPAHLGAFDLIVNTVPEQILKG
ncbi:MAG: hypothetical protein LBU87_04905, partial [Lactobacillales bacterium]|nr:hypothetical protein [Lactobacillales bacterium]